MRRSSSQQVQLTVKRLYTKYPGSWNQKGLLAGKLYVKDPSFKAGGSSQCCSSESVVSGRSVTCSTYIGRSSLKVHVNSSWFKFISGYAVEVEGNRGQRSEVNSASGHICFHSENQVWSTKILMDDHTRTINWHITKFWCILSSMPSMHVTGLFNTTCVIRGLWGLVVFSVVIITQ